jgi:drug/metabolite transporter (DMT)-like permease
VWGLLLLMRREKIIYQVKKVSIKVWRDIGLVLFCSLFWIFFFAKAFETGSLSFVSAITACSPAITTLLARIFLHEKLSYIQYWAIFILVLGISGLSYFSL